MSAMAGDLPGFEEAIRALYADERARFAELIVACRTTCASTRSGWRLIRPISARELLLE